MNKKNVSRLILISDVAIIGFLLVLAVVILVIETFKSSISPYSMFALLFLLAVYFKDKVIIFLIKDNIRRSIEICKGKQANPKNDIISNSFSFDDLRELFVLVSEVIEKNDKLEKRVRNVDKFQSLIENAGDAIVVIQDFKPVFYNRAALILFGYSSQDEIPGNFLELIHVSDRKEIEYRYQLRMEGKNLPVRSEFRVLTRDGNDKYVEATITRTDWDGKPSVMNILRDISARKKAEIEREKMEKLRRQSQKMESIGALAGGIAHDFNNILAPIVGFSDMLLDKFSDESGIKDALQTIHNSSLRAKKLVDQILRFSREEPIEMRPMMFRDVLVEITSLLRSTLPASIELEIKNSFGFALVNVDPMQIQQVFLNICLNASQAMASKGRINIVVSQAEVSKDKKVLQLTPGYYLRIVINDNGPGIPDEIQDRVFDPFFTTKPIGQGTGMGLAIVHGIVQVHRGAVDMISRLGEGTEFVIYLPLIKSLDVQEISELRKPVVGGNEKILFVDDEEYIRDLGLDILEPLGYRVTVESNGRRAFDLFLKDPFAFDLVITDMAMPKMSGDDLAVEILKIRSDMPIILCTGFSETMSEAKAKALGIKQYIMKPILISSLSEAIHQALKGE